jgi:hypothetical protein
MDTQNDALLFSPSPRSYKLTRHIPISHHPDVIVCGGGPSGVAAAVAAARNGARVLLIERYGFLGGSATAMQVPAFAPFSDRQKAVVRGIGWEIMTRMQALRGKPLPDPNTYSVPQDNARMDWVPIDAELLKRLYDDLCQEAGVTVLFHTVIPDLVLKTSHRHVAGLPRKGVRGVILSNKDGLSLAEASVFIDTTGDADLVARMGSPFEQGDENGRTQGMTMCFTIAGGNREQYLAYVYKTGDGFLARLIAEARQQGDYTLPDASLVGMSFKNDTVAGCNMGHLYGFDSTSTLSLSEAEREGRRVVAQLIPFIQKYIPGQENAFLVSSGPQIGIRESRRIIGEYKLTQEDYLACRSFPDDIARNAYFIDVHAVTTEDAARAKEPGGKNPFVLAPGQSHGIPYRSLIPIEARNVLVAGRSLSADRAVQGAVRVMPLGFAMGEAAGTAAAIAALHHKGEVRKVNITTLQQRLREQGAWLG